MIRPEAATRAVGYPMTAVTSACMSAPTDTSGTDGLACAQHLRDCSRRVAQSGDLLRTHVREHRQREHLGGGALRDGQRIWREVLVGVHAMDRRRIVNTRLDSKRVTQRPDFTSPRHADYGQVVGATR